VGDGFALSEAQVREFVVNGFVRIDKAFPRELADACRKILWLATQCKEDDPATWTRPVVRIGHIPNPLFREAATTPTLCAAYDALVGAERWTRPGGLGTFPIRFPSALDPGDCGWHIDASFGTENEPNFLNWRVNIASKGRALLMLFLFSDVSERDAPTRLRIGSHLDIARRLAPHGDEGLTIGELAAADHAESSHCPEAFVMGPAGTVYLCHPFIVHAAQPHRGSVPRFLAQPPLLPKGALDPWHGTSPVERAIRLAIETRGD
jgi:hypothetical protein